MAKTNLKKMHRTEEANGYAKWSTAEETIEEAERWSMSLPLELFNYRCVLLPITEDEGTNGNQAETAD